MRQLNDVEEAVDIVEEVTNRFKEGKDLDDIFYIGYGADHSQMKMEGGRWVFFGWDTGEENYEKCRSLMDQLLQQLREREEIAEIQTQEHEEFYDDDPVRGGAWHIRFRD